MSGFVPQPDLRWGGSLNVGEGVWGENDVYVRGMMRWNHAVSMSYRVVEFRDFQMAAPKDI
ncbi:hypothetical protein JCM14469_24190 [Desulfatiferula olefinivorans]